MVAISFTIPNFGTSSNSRRPQFISSGINSGIASALQLKTGTWTPVAAQVYNLAAGSPNCAGSPRVCTIYFPAPTGTDQFELDTYNGIVGAGSNCTTSNAIGSSCSLGSELSSGMALGPSGAGVSVSAGSTTSVTISLQAIIASIVPGGLYTSSVSTSTGSSAPGPAFAFPAFVVGAQTNNTQQTNPVCWSDNPGNFIGTACTGAQNEDASGVTINQSTATCSQLQNDFASPFQLFPATVGGNVNDLTKGIAAIQFQACASVGTGNGIITVTSGAGAPQSTTSYEVVDKPGAVVQFSYNGGGGGGDESTTAPFWAAATSTTTGFPGTSIVPVGITSPVQAATSPQAITGATMAAKPVAYILAPLYGVVQDAASLGGAVRESGSSNNVTLNLAGPDGYTAKLWAAQAAVPTEQSASGYQVIQPGSCAGVFTLGTRTTGKWGAMWPINGGGTAASGTTCQILLYDNDQPTNHYVVVTITNTVGSGGVSFAPPLTPQNLYVGNPGNSNILVFPANPSGNVTSAPQATIGGGSTGLAFPTGVALDASGKIYVADYNSSNVLVFAANPSGNVTSAPLATIGGGSTGIQNPQGVAIDASGKIYVANFGNNNILVFAANPSGNVTSAPVATIGGGSTTISFPRGVALDASGNIYVASAGNNNILVFAANPSGNVTSAPLATIGGGSTGINLPFGVGLDASGQIYVANDGNNNVEVFAANPSGNVTSTPLATIGGGSTGINKPIGVALDASGQIYVANCGNGCGGGTGSGSVTVYAANPSGNVTSAPLATYGGGSTGIKNPWGVAIR
jgi:sugar lactone lactonase YvrE